VSGEQPSFSKTASFLTTLSTLVRLVTSDPTRFKLPTDIADSANKTTRTLVAVIDALKSTIEL
jgi:hypothetical protein